VDEKKLVGVNPCKSPAGCGGVKPIVSGVASGGQADSEKPINDKAKTNHIDDRRAAGLPNEIKNRAQLQYNYNTTTIQKPFKKRVPPIDLVQDLVLVQDHSPVPLPPEAEGEPQFGYSPTFSEPIVIEFLSRSKIKPVIAELWLKTYPDPGWVQTEVLKIISWMEGNPMRRPKSRFAHFISSWLSRGWEWHRKNIPVKTSGTNWDTVFKKEDTKS
jgi:hypothetical protein